MSGLFIGVSVNLERAIMCLDSAKQLWSGHKHIHWFEPESLHCTLAYVDVKRSRYRYIGTTMCKIMDQVCLGNIQFATVLNQFEWFGQNGILVLTNPQNHASTKLSQLARTIARRLRGQNVQAIQGQPFRAHVSFGERNMQTKSILNSIFNTPPSTKQLNLRLVVDNINLYQSIGNHQYKILHTTELTVPKSAK